MATTHPRTGLVLGTTLAIAAVGAGLVLFLQPGDDTDLDTLPDPATTTVTTTTAEPLDIAALPSSEPAMTAAGTDEADTSDDSAEGYEPDDVHYPGEAPLPLPPMGIDKLEYAWTTTELTSSSGEIWMGQLIEIDGTMWAIGGGYDEAIDRERSLIFTSDDGVNWESHELPGEISDIGHPQFTATEAGLVAVVDAWDEETGRHDLYVFTSADGETWVEGDLSGVLDGERHLWVNNVAGANDVLLLTGVEETVPETRYEPEPVIIEFEGYSIEVDEYNWSYLVTDISSGEVVVFGSQEQLWTHDQEYDFTIYDPAAGEVIFAMRWHELDQAGRLAYENATWGDPMLVTVAKDDRTLTLDEFTGSVTVTDADGTLLFEGTEHDLWRGPPPTIRNRDGEVVIVVPWEVWDAAHQSAYGVSEEAYHATPVMLRSEDGGATWSGVDIASAVPEGFYFQDTVAGPDGFLTIGTIQSGWEECGCDYEPQDPPTVLTSTDGLAWRTLETDLDAFGWLQSLTADEDGYSAVRSGPDGQNELVRSADGATWSVALTNDDLDLEFGHVWFERTATSELGTFVYGMYDGYTQPDTTAVTISKAGRTLTIEGPLYAVVDDATGEVLFTFDERTARYDEEPFGATADGFRWGQGGFLMFDDNGGVIFAVTHGEHEHAMNEVWSEPSQYYETEAVLLVSDGDGWLRVPLPELQPYAWINGIIATDDGVCLIVHSETHTGYYEVVNLALVGAPAS